MFIAGWNLLAKKHDTIEEAIADAETQLRDRDLEAGETTELPIFEVHEVAVVQASASVVVNLATARRVESPR